MGLQIPVLYQIEPGENNPRIPGSERKYNDKDGVPEHTHLISYIFVWKLKCIIIRCCI
jgi:hypothetical protein